MNKRLNEQLNFIKTVDKIKSVFRQTKLMDGSRYENDAEHSWHIAIMALVLSEYSNNSVDILKVLKMLLIHDLVEIYAGDTFCYDLEANKDKYDREKKAAEKLFAILPNDQRVEFVLLWEEFELMNTPESKFAAALDRLHPILHNYANKGGAWKEHNVSVSDVRKRNMHISNGSKTLWNLVNDLLSDSVENNFFNT